MMPLYPYRNQSNEQLTVRNSNTSVISSVSDASSSTTSGPALLLSKYTIAVPSAIESLNSSSNDTPLGAAFEPGACDVVCGRGKGSYNRPGNRQFRGLVAAHIPRYAAARSKADKSSILNSIIDEVRSLCNPGTGRPAQFVKYSKRDGGWMAIGDDQAREKVGHAMREAIAAATKDGNDSAAKRAIKEQIESKRDVLLSQQQSLFEELRRSSLVVKQQVVGV